MDGFLELVASSSPMPVLTRANFRVVTDGLRYRMFVEYTQLPARGPKSREYTFDGRDTYEVIVWPREMLTKSTNTHKAHVYALARPSDVNFLELAPWFAFCSQQYLRTITNESVWSFLRFPRQGEAPKSLQVERMHEPATGFLTNMNVYGTPVPRPSSKTNAVDAGPRIVAQLTSDSFGELRGKPVPTVMRFTSFVVTRYNQVKVTVTNYAAIDTLASWVPAIEQTTTISDRRFPKPGAVVYSTLDHGWLNRDDPKLAAQINKLIHRRENRAPPQISWPVTVLFAVLFLLPVWPIVREQLNKRKQQQHNKKE